MAGMCPLCVKYDGSEVIAKAEHDDFGRAMVVACPRCGRFRVEGVQALSSAGDSVLLRLSGLARIETREGRRLEINAGNFARLAASAPAPTAMGGYYDRLLQVLAARCGHPGADTPEFPLTELAAEAFLPTRSCMQALMELSDLVALVDTDQQRMRCRLKPAGWRRVDELTRRAPHGDRAFVAMWFADEMSDAYAMGFHTALVACGYEPPFRVDAPEHQERADDPDFKSKIDDRILAEIRRARFVVADATGARPSVYYEAGFADGLGTPVIWACRADHESKMSFDTRQIEHILWKDPADLQEQLKAKIERRGWSRVG